MERTPEFDVFFESHIRKIVALRGNDADDRRRYVSKNNLKVARLTVRPPPPSRTEPS